MENSYVPCVWPVSPKVRVSPAHSKTIDWPAAELRRTSPLTHVSWAAEDSDGYPTEFVRVVC